MLSSANCANFMNYIDEEFKKQSLSTMQMVGAMIASQPRYEKRFIDCLLSKVERLVPIDEISPVIFAAIKIYVFSETLDRRMAIQACAPEYALIRATGKEQDFLCAIRVVTNITYKYVDLGAHLGNCKCNDFV